ncbi:exodeoxyribonuclease III [Sideroxydans lithotrophicus]|uniref:Exodeoxyribonuclease III Xth n=1 Tax=Sideroxydans lithotrophicus (strain ES-1) TaxID=580332 RepID=D5CTG7_SIDLE|nr:exodeoxyribonuclease III [Sideroxydans lithotrophicus]ADE10273.1 exodeoxyribonuclease III Xth [Sideroxydans lithotrophicus ES-1]
MRIITLNLNGIRSAYNKGLLEWFSRQDADILCVQELKAQAADMTADMLSPLGYHGYFHYAEKKGYSGVGIYSKRKPDSVIVGLDIPEFDAEGRYIEAQFGNLSVVSLYLPSGSSGEERQAVKFKFMEAFMPHLRQMMENSKVPVVGESRLLPQTAGSTSNVSQPHMVQLQRSGRDVIVCGDWNIAHTEKDLRNWRGNKKNSGFLPEERAWLTELLGEVGFVDVFRKLHPELEAYTWWSNRGQAWAKDVGWRIDYQIATPGMAAKAVSTGIYKEQRFSDHAPLMVDYKD